MDGMTRLREFAATLEPELRDIAGQIEGEAHPAGEREAIAWVREHGGIDEIEKRLMPEGMEWPTVDGRQVDFRTLYEPSLGVLEAVCIYSNGACEVMGHNGIISGIEDVHISLPDAWEDIDDDLTMSPGAYCAMRGIDLGDDPDRETAIVEMCRDLVLRARELAGRGER